MIWQITVHILRKRRARHAGGQISQVQNLDDWECLKESEDFLPVPS
jgi:hypothetical protein